MDDLIDIKPPVELAPDLMWLWILLGVIYVVGMSVIVYLIVKHTPLNRGRILSPVDVAMAHLEYLAKQNLLAKGDYSLYYEHLSRIVRNYIEGRFLIHAPEMTTDEFLNHVKNHEGMSLAHKDILRDFLTESDLVKFAKYIPQHDAAAKGLTLVRQFIDETRHGT